VTLLKEFFLDEASSSKQTPNIGDYVVSLSDKRIGRVIAIDPPSVKVNMGGPRAEEFFLGLMKRTTKKYKGRPVWREV